MGWGGGLGGGGQRVGGDLFLNCLASLLHVLKKGKNLLPVGANSFLLEYV